MWWISGCLWSNSCPLCLIKFLWSYQPRSNGAEGMRTTTAPCLNLLYWTWSGLIFLYRIIYVDEAHLGECQALFKLSENGEWSWDMRSIWLARGHVFSFPPVFASDVKFSARKVHLVAFRPWTFAAFRPWTFAAIPTTVCRGICSKVIACLRCCILALRIAHRCGVKGARERLITSVSHRTRIIHGNVHMKLV